MSFIAVYKIPKEQYEKGKFLGKGAFGEVFESELKHIKIMAAMKVLKDSSGQNQRSFMAELENLSMIQHPACLGLRGFDIPEDGKPILFIPLLSKGTMEKFINSFRENRQKEIIDETEIWNLKTTFAISFYGISSALRYLHGKDIIHRDLKPENILYNQFKYPYVGDFGLTISISNLGEKSSEVAGTLLYMAPECFEGKYVPESDIFSFGMILYQIWNKDINNYVQYPLDGKPYLVPNTSPQLYEKIHEIRKAGIRPYKLDDCPPRMWEIIHKCLEPNPKDRYSAAELVEIFKDPHSIFDDIKEDEFKNYLEMIDFEEQKVHADKIKNHIFHPVEPPFSE